MKINKPKELVGSISIGKVTCSDQDNYVRIEIQDKSSGLIIIQTEMTLKNYAEALCGLGYVPIKYKLYNTSKVGMKLECKTEKVKIPQIGFLSDDIREAVAKYEVDGWKGTDSDAKNFHNSVFGSQSTYRISYHRYV